MKARQCSLVLSLDRFFETAEDATAEVRPIRRTEVLAALLEAGISKETLFGIEATQKTRYYVVFTDTEERDAHVNTELTIRNQTVTLRHPNPPMVQLKPDRTKVKIFNYPLDADTDHLAKHLKHYGDFPPSALIFMIDRSCDVRTGGRICYMEMHTDLPSYMYVGPHLIRIDYEGHKRTCRKCHTFGHEARECKVNVTCKSCGASDHNKKNCPQIVCYTCGERGHVEQRCPNYFDHFPPLDPGFQELNPTFIPQETDNPPVDPPDTDPPKLGPTDPPPFLNIDNWDGGDPSDPTGYMLRDSYPMDEDQATKLPGPPADTPPKTITNLSENRINKDNDDETHDPHPEPSAKKVRTASPENSSNEQRAPQNTTPPTNTQTAHMETSHSEAPAINNNPPPSTETSENFTFVEPKRAAQHRRSRDSAKQPPSTRSGRNPSRSPLTSREKALAQKIPPRSHSLPRYAQAIAQGKSRLVLNPDPKSNGNTV